MELCDGFSEGGEVECFFFCGGDWGGGEGVGECLGGCGGGVGCAEGWWWGGHCWGDGVVEVEGWVFDGGEGCLAEGLRSRDFVG